MSESFTFVPYKLFTGAFIPEWLMQHTGLTASEKLVWARLAQYAGKDGYCWPKQETIAEDCGISTRQVVRSINTLIDLKFIKVTKPTGNDKWGHKGNVYEFICNDVIRNELEKIGVTVTSLGDKMSPRTKCQNVTSLYREKNHVEKSQVIAKKSSRTKPPRKSSNSTPQNKPELFKTKKDTSKHFISMLPRPYQDNEAFIEVWIDYLQSRKHKATQQAVKRIVNDLIEGAGNNIPFAIESFNLTIKKGWVIPYYTLPNKDVKQPESKQTAPKRKQTSIGPTEEYDYTKDKNYVDDDDMMDIPGLGRRK